MDTDQPKILILGAGVSGLVAAITFEKHDLSPLIIDADDRVGGKLKTDLVDGYQLDRGFQVLLDAYPLLHKYLDLKGLKLQRFKPGAFIFENGVMQVLGDPRRDRSKLIPSLRSNIANLKDIIKIFSLNKHLNNKSIDDIFESKELSTYDYLKQRGFSERIIEKFFRPFFSGIFLEHELKTSSRMFEFVFKMFGTGHAVLPESGIEAVPKQLLEGLARTKLKLNTHVKALGDKELILEDGTSMPFDYLILACEPSKFLPTMQPSSIQWKSCENLYFETTDRRIKDATIGLLADANCLINNIFYHTSLPCASKGANELLSVTVVREHTLSESELVKRVEEELKNHCGICVQRHLRTYKIPKALPDLPSLHGDMSASSTQIKKDVFLAGDYLLNGSLNAAMLSGERAAEGLLEQL